MLKSDVLIIGSGIAGLSVAIKVAQRFPDRKCVIITKQESAESNTRYAQGGIAVVSDLVHDSYEAHIADTLNAGDGLCDRVVVEHVVRQAPLRLKELVDMGADFDRSSSGELVLGREGGHKANRIIHAQDVTGLNISTALLRRVNSLPNIQVLSHHMAIDLITSNGGQGVGNQTVCQGAIVLDQKTGNVEDHLAAATVLATGGIGQLYRTTTNPHIATGDGIAMACRAGARVSNMEFIQFHPTALYDPGSSPAFLISEAVRGQGAYLRNAAGERFMFRYHIDGELACRDVVARAIASEIQAGSDPFVYLDCTHVPEQTLEKHFPNILQTCLSKGIDIRKDYIPVAPAAHYLCGGINVDIHSRTNITNLYACGECSNTGLHGANRLASNSLLEATVFAHNCFEHISSALKMKVVSDVSQTKPIRISTEESRDMRHRMMLLQNLMSHCVGIVRSDGGLSHADLELENLERDLVMGSAGLMRSASWYELRNMITCARLIVQQSRLRRENRGGFYNASLVCEQALS